MKREWDVAINLPFRGEGRKLSEGAGRTGVAGSPRLAQPVGQLPAALDYVQCGTLPGPCPLQLHLDGTGTGRVPLVGPAWGSGLFAWG